MRKKICRIQRQAFAWFEWKLEENLFGKMIVASSIIEDEKTTRDTQWSISSSCLLFWSLLWSQTGRDNSWRRHDVNLTTHDRDIEDAKVDRGKSRTDRIEIWELITTDKIKNMCISSANEVVNDHRPMCARAGLSRLHSRWARPFLSNSCNSSCAFSNSLLRSHVSSQRILYSCLSLVHLLSRILMISHFCFSSFSFKSAVSVVRLKCKLSIALVIIIDSIAVRSVESHIHDEVVWSVIDLTTSSLSEDCLEISDDTEADETFENRR